jgi:hypothetical protein
MGATGFPTVIALWNSGSLSRNDASGWRAAAGSL